MLGFSLCKILSRKKNPDIKNLIMLLKIFMLMFHFSSNVVVLIIFVFFTVYIIK